MADKVITPVQIWAAIELFEEETASVVGFGGVMHHGDFARADSRAGTPLTTHFADVLTRVVFEGEVPEAWRKAREESAQAPS